jgi:hypothetical protein
MEQERKIVPVDGKISPKIMGIIYLTTSFVPECKMLW